MDTQISNIAKKVTTGNKKVSKVANPTFIDLFSGIGGFRIALENLGCHSVGFSEIDRKAIAVYKNYFDTSKEVEIGDITKVLNLPYAELLVGGVPCQSWSIAGKMKGFEDPRGKLWLDTINLTKEVMPKGFIYENVKGLADPRNRYNLDLIIKEFNQAGYNTYYNVLNAFDYGIPQSRERLFIVGIRKDLDKNNFTFPEKHKNLPFLANILDGGVKNPRTALNHLGYKNSFSMAAVANKGNFYIFSDVRNGDHTIHSWDLVKTTEKEKTICVLIMKNRRKSMYGPKDGNPMSYKDIANLVANSMFKKEEISQSDLEGLVKKNILRKSDDGKYEFTNSKISSGINGVYRIFLPQSHVFSTLTKSGNLDYVAEVAIPESVKDKKKYFIEEIFLKKKYRLLTIKEATRVQGFPDDFIFNTNYSVAMGLLGNAVAVNVVELLAKKLINSLK